MPTFQTLFAILEKDEQRSTTCALRVFHPSVELSSIEQTIITRIKRVKLFVFLRFHRHELFDDAFQEELVTLYAPSLRGHPPLSPTENLFDIGKSLTGGK